MDLEHIRELLAMVAESGVAEVEIEEDGFKLTVRKNAPTVTMQPSAPSYMPYGMTPMAPPFGAGGYGMPAPPQQAPGGGQAAPAPPSAAQTAATQEATEEPEAPAEAPAGGDDDGGDDDGGDDGGGVTVKAPIVGTFYRRPSPDDDPYVDAGDSVATGDVLCIIEAMKLMNEVECETPGTIKKVLVEDGEPVEYEQPLFVIDPA